MQRVSSQKPLSRRSWCFILSFAWVLHNSEEWLLATQMLQFMQSDAPEFVRHVYAGITVPELRAVLLILTSVVLLVIATAASFASTVTAAFGTMVLAALLGLNAVFHIALFIDTGAYAPGLVTGVMVSLPIAVVLLVQARRQRWTPAPAFLAVVPAAFLVHGPVLDVLFRTGLSVVRTS